MAAAGQSIDTIDTINSKAISLCYELIRGPSKWDHARELDKKVFDFMVELDSSGLDSKICNTIKSVVFTSLISSFVADFAKPNQWKFGDMSKMLLRIPFVRWVNQNPYAPALKTLASTKLYETANKAATDPNFDLANTKDHLFAAIVKPAQFVSKLFSSTVVHDPSDGYYTYDLYSRFFCRVQAENVDFTFLTHGIHDPTQILSYITEDGRFIKLKGHVSVKWYIGPSMVWFGVHPEDVRFSSVDNRYGSTVLFVDKNRLWPQLGARVHKSLGTRKFTLEHAQATLVSPPDSPFADGLDDCTYPRGPDGSPNYIQMNRPKRVGSFDHPEFAIEVDEGDELIIPIDCVHLRFFEHTTCQPNLVNGKRDEKCTHSGSGYARETIFNILQDKFRIGYSKTGSDGSFTLGHR